MTLNGREFFVQKGTLAPTGLLNIFFSPSSRRLSYLKLFNLVIDFFCLVFGVVVFCSFFLKQLTGEKVRGERYKLLV